MPTNKKELKTYTTDEIIKKFTHIAKTENRSISKQLEYIIKQEISRYEAEKGEIILECDSTDK